jgi:RNA polymerase-binding transcription factor DksA
MDPAPDPGTADDDRAAAGPPTPGADTDLDRLAADLADVERAMQRIEEGTYWTDEVTGSPLSDELLSERPTARRDAAPPTEP